jgi:hypothetical protein
MRLINLNDKKSIFLGIICIIITIYSFVHILDTRFSPLPSEAIFIFDFFTFFAYFWIGSIFAILLFMHLITREATLFSISVVLLFAIVTCLSFSPSTTAFFDALWGRMVLSELSDYGTDPSKYEHEMHCVQFDTKDKNQCVAYGRGLPACSSDKKICIIAESKKRSFGCTSYIVWFSQKITRTDNETSMNAFLKVWGSDEGQILYSRSINENYLVTNRCDPLW